MKKIRTPASLAMRGSNGISDDAITLRMCAKLWRQLERMEGEND